MKKLFTSLCAMMIVALSLASVSCNKGEEGKDSNKKEQTAKKSATSERPAANRTGEKPNYRYVDSDSLLANYNLAKDYQEEMLRQQNNYDNTARQRQSAIQSLMQKYDQQMRNNQMDQDAYNKAMADHTEPAAGRRKGAGPDAGEHAEPDDGGAEDSERLHNELYRGIQQDPWL